MKRSFLKTLMAIAGASFRLRVPRREPGRYTFAFVVHPRDHADIVRGIPLLRFVPKSWARAFVKRLPPHVIADMTGLRDIDGRPMTGALIGVGWDREMFEQDVAGRELKIAKTARLIGHMAVRFGGLGALLPWASRYGCCLDGSLPRSEVERLALPEATLRELFVDPHTVNLVPKDPGFDARVRDLAGPKAPRLLALVKAARAAREARADLTLTTGHPFTVAVIAGLVDRVLALHPKPAPVVAIVGAAGSTGACCSLELARRGVSHLVLLDRKKSTGVTSLETLATDVLSQNPGCRIETTTELSDLARADVIVVVSSAEGTIINTSMLSPGTVVIDDSQPRNVDPKIAAIRPDVRIVTVLARLEGFNPNFRFDRHTPLTDASFTCAADVALRAATRTATSAVGPATPEGIATVMEMARALKHATGFDALTPIFYSYDRRVISEDELVGVMALGQARR